MDANVTPLPKTKHVTVITKHAHQTYLANSVSIKTS